MFQPKLGLTGAMTMTFHTELRMYAFRTSWNRRVVAWAWAIMALLLGLSAWPAWAEEAADVDPLAREMLLRADRIRFPDGGFQVDVVITTTQPDSEPDVRAYRILSKGNSRTLVQTTAPAVDRNQILLMRDRDLWAFLPNLVPAHPAAAVATSDWTGRQWRSGSSQFCGGLRAEATAQGKN